MPTQGDAVEWEGHWYIVCRIRTTEGHLMLCRHRSCMKQALPASMMQVTCPRPYG